MIQVRKAGKHLGAEISGVDLSQELDGDTFAQIAKAFFENEVAFFRDQKITPQQQIAFTRRFGTLEQHVRKESRLPGYPEILVVSNLVKEDGTPIGAQDAATACASLIRQMTPTAAATAMTVPSLSAPRVRSNRSIESAPRTPAAAEATACIRSAITCARCCEPRTSTPRPATATPFSGGKRD